MDQPIPAVLSILDAARLLSGKHDGGMWLAEMLGARNELGAEVSGYAQEWTDRIRTDVLRDYLVRNHGRDLLVPQPQPQVAADTLDPVDLPDELDTAMLAFRAVHNGYGKASESFKKRLLAWIAEHRSDLGKEARERIATVANPDKAPGRKARREE